MCVPSPQKTQSTRAESPVSIPPVPTSPEGPSIPAVSAPLLPSRTPPSAFTADTPQTQPSVASGGSKDQFGPLTPDLTYRSMNRGTPRNHMDSISYLTLASTQAPPPSTCSGLRVVMLPPAGSCCSGPRSPEEAEGGLVCYRVWPWAQQATSASGPSPALWAAGPGVHPRPRAPSAPPPPSAETPRPQRVLGKSKENRGTRSASAADAISGRGWKTR